MLNSVTLENFGPIEALDWNNLGKINLIIGGNGSGKTFLLKAIYTALRTIETYKRGDDKRTAAEILFDKLYWTFQPEKIGDLVTKGANAGLSCKIVLNDREFNYRFGKDTYKHIQQLENHLEPRQSNTIFLPAKEVLSLHHIILKSRDQDRIFGFDDTYADLVKALQIPMRAGKNIKEFSNARSELEEILKGKIEYDDSGSRWQFKNKTNQKFNIGATAEGVKKIAILDILLGNRSIDKDSILLIDEPQSALHPVAIAKLLDIFARLAERGIQVFFASHSYFVVKKLFLIAQGKAMSIPVLSAEDGQAWRSSDLLKGMPDNSIINESIRLYRQELELSLQ